MTGTWSVLQHVAWEGPGLIAREAAGCGVSLDTWRPNLDVKFPVASDIEGLIVMGGPMGAYDIDKYPFLAEECSLIEDMVRRGRPVLGICLGAQLLARALGARVLPGHGPR